MKKVLCSIAGTFAFVATCIAAQAADYQAPVMPPVPVYTWTGLYIGANGGYGFGQQTPKDTIHAKRNIIRSSLRFARVVIFDQFPGFPDVIPAGECGDVTGA
jgi:hypothetical protein